MSGRVPNGNRLFDDYLAQVCRHIRAKDIHSDVKAELLSHLDEVMDEKLSQGLSETDAAREAIKQMGEPHVVGKQLNTVHKPVMEWGLLGLVGVLVGIGLVAMYAMQFALSDRYGEYFFENKVVFVIMGSLFMFGVYFLDYRIFKKYSWHLYGLTVMLFLLCILMGTEVNGSRRYLLFGAWGLNVHDLSIYMLILAFAGVMAGKDSANRDRLQQTAHVVKLAAAFLLFPAIMYLLGSSYLQLSIYLFGISTIVLFVLKRKKLFWRGMLGLTGAMAVFYMVSGPFRRHFHDRLNTFLHPESDPQSSGYLVAGSMRSIQEGGLWGQGFGAVNDRLPFLHSDMVISYLIYSFGWAFGAAMLMLVAGFVIRLIQICRELKDPYAKAAVIGLVSILGLRMIWNAAMQLGLLPMTSITMPFVSYGNTAAIVELAAIGFILSARRRKNMLRRSSSKVETSLLE